MLLAKGNRLRINVTTEHPGAVRVRQEIGDHPAAPATEIEQAAHGTRIAVAGDGLDKLAIIPETEDFVFLHVLVALGFLHQVGGRVRNGVPDVGREEEGGQPGDRDAPFTANDADAVHVRRPQLSRPEMEPKSGAPRMREMGIFAGHLRVELDGGGAKLVSVYKQLNV